jgi:putative hydrolase of the HAD superfamily
LCVRPNPCEVNSARPPNQMRERPAWRAVISDLWDTLVEFPWELAKVHLVELARQLRVDVDRLYAVWRELEPSWETMPLDRSLELLCRELGVKHADVDKLCDLRLDYMRQALTPRAEVIETLRELRGRDLRLGLISACSGDVPAVWAETPLAALIDVTVFSSAVGFRKPDPRIYRLASLKLGVEASACLYVGDGGHDELGGAARAGMTAVLLQADRRLDPPPHLERITQISTIPEVLRLL